MTLPDRPGNKACSPVQHLGSSPHSRTPVSSLPLPERGEGPPHPPFPSPAKPGCWGAASPQAREKPRRPAAALAVLRDRGRWFQRLQPPGPKDRRRSTGTSLPFQRLHMGQARLQCARPAPLATKTSTNFCQTPRDSELLPLACMEEVSNCLREFRCTSCQRSTGALAISRSTAARTLSCSFRSRTSKKLKASPGLYLSYHHKETLKKPSYLL